MSSNHKNHPPCTSIPLKVVFSTSKEDSKNKTSDSTSPSPPPQFEETDSMLEDELSEIREDIDDIYDQLELLQSNTPGNIDLESLRHKRSIESDREFVKNFLKAFTGVVLLTMLFVWFMVWLHIWNKNSTPACTGSN
ncbi:hypothetical protein DFJ63DRAFT_314879 [Scheffersomyces coipomensis]|uniref:uncharacterized protein n=1 Tax=Scheffersomyces coipomensis TaxID=1788519 RepID=UPI00315D8B41